MRYRPFILLIIFLCITTSAFASALESTSCVGANGFLGQTNIASVISNKASGDLSVTVRYFDAEGILKGAAFHVLTPKQKFDFIINDLGLLSDTVGTVCVETDAQTAGEWLGGVTIYKPDTRNGEVSFGEAFDYALYYPFTNPLSGTYTAALNTFHLGVPETSTVANWISIYDAIPGDLIGVEGDLVYYNAEGVEVLRVPVNFPDGGRRDFPGHEPIGGEANIGAYGLAAFEPVAEETKYYLTVTRYFYDCFNANCSNFYTAFNLPVEQPGTYATGPVSTFRDEYSVIELNNPGEIAATNQVDVADGIGINVGMMTVDVPARGTYHVVINKSESTGFLPNDTAGLSVNNVQTGSLNFTSVRYKLDQFGVLQYAFATPLGASPGTEQISQFNSYIGHANELELSNSSGGEAKIRARVIDTAGTVLWNNDDIRVGPYASKRFTLLLPDNTYGTVSILSDTIGVTSRVRTSAIGSYTISYPGVATSGLGSLSENTLGRVITKNFRVMPLGDSITESQAGQTSYRYWLYKSLLNAGFVPNFIGSKTGVRFGSPLYPDFDQQHEGHSGWRADQILARIGFWADRYKPDIYLIHLGTNDLIQGVNSGQSGIVPATVSDLRNIIDTIRRETPLAMIVLAKIIPNNRPVSSLLNELNKRIPEIVAEKHRTTSPVLLADQFTGYNLSDNYDGIHPGISGDQKMSAVWFNKIMELLQ